MSKAEFREEYGQLKGNFFIMSIAQSVFEYLLDMESTLASEIMKESSVETITIDSVFVSDFSEWDIIDVVISIRAKYFKEIDGEYLKDKELIENVIISFFKRTQQRVSHITWAPLLSFKRTIEKADKRQQALESLKTKDFDRFFDILKSIFASLSYNMKTTEAYFHSNIHTLLLTLGFNILSEQETNIGRIDSVIELDDCVYIIEFKTTSAEDAINQIEAKKYYERFLGAQKKIFLVGVGCSIEEKNIEKWLVKEYN